MSEKFNRINWVAGPRRGPAANRNHGVRHSRGEWIVFTDDDCVPSVGWLEAYAAAIVPGIELYEGPTTCEGGIRRFADDAPINLAGGTFPSCNLMISRRLFDEIGGFDENFPPHAIMEDIDFRTRVLANNRSWKFVSEAVVDHPPRPRATGWRATARWENTVYYWAKRNVSPPYGNNLAAFVLKVRLAEMIKRHRIRDYPAALISLAGEWWHVVCHLRSWNMKHRITRKQAGSPCVS